MKGFSLNWTQVNNKCSSLLNASTGFFKYPNGTTNYPSNANCSWIITTAPKTSINFFISMLDTEKDFDFLYIRDGNNSQSPLLLSLSGNQALPPMFSSSNKLFLQFSSDQSTSLTGFTFHWQQVERNKTVQITRLYTAPFGMGQFWDFNSSIPDLGVYGFENTIRSICLTGIWIYYENIDFNKIPGQVFWMPGFKSCTNLPRNFQNSKFSSVRFAGSPTNINSDSWTLYDGASFTRNSLYGTQDSGDLGELDLKVSSVILTGTSPWSFYSGKGWNGRGACVFPTQYYTLENGERFNFRLIPRITAMNIPDNAVRSIKKGCPSLLPSAHSHPFLVIHPPSILPSLLQPPLAPSQPYPASLLHPHYRTHHFNHPLSHHHLGDHFHH
ncbi:unnamed protein product [Meganyctiphanes norvegica]|uniref:CUB domain-containing protein n=1 Tax=Meganyctiphanes norvegica TaxID=48144 RepID=A0AAV2R0I6_MEGNR